MMRVRFLRGTALGGIGNDAYPGDERDLDDLLARQLIAGGRAIPATDGQAAQPPEPSKLKRKAKE